MTRVGVVLALALLLGLSPVLSSYAASIYYCDDALSGFHLSDRIHANNEHNHGDDHGEVSHHSDNFEAHHDRSHQDHYSDEAAGIHTETMAPGSCSCSSANPPTPQSVAVLTTSKIDRKIGKVAPGDFLAARDATLEHTRFSIYLVAGKDKSPPVSDLFLLNHSFLL